MFGSTIYNSLTKINAKVELYEGSTDILKKTCSCNDELESFNVDREGDTSKFFGFGVCHQMKCTLIDLDHDINVAKGDTIKLYFGSAEQDKWDKPFPKFYVTEVERDEKNDSIFITAYDLLYYKATEHTISEVLESADLSYPYNLWDLSVAICLFLGIGLSASYDTSDRLHALIFTEDNLPYWEGDESLRIVLAQIAEATQSIYYLMGFNTERDTLRLQELSATGSADLTITKDNYFELSAKPPVVLKSICTVTELGENIEAVKEEITEGVTQYIRENPFFATMQPSELATYLNAAIDFIGGLSAAPFNCDWEGNYRLAVGDKIALEASDGTTHYSYVICDNLSYAGALNQVTEWEYTQDKDETATNSSNLGVVLNQTFAKVDKAAREVTILASEVTQYGDRIDAAEDKAEEAESKVAELKLDTDIIKSTVSTLQETADTHTSQIGALQVSAGEISASVTNIIETSRVSTENIEEQIEQLTQEVSTKVTAENLTVTVRNEIANGVDRVETITGYTLDNNGLTIEKSGKEMKTQITEDGMTVYRDTTAVLTANNTGVDAKNLKASTYLVIGTNSRFENYGTSRTACFWIGD